MSAQQSPRPLSVDSVVEAALRIADAAGLPALSMRRVASELDSAPMSLYRHVQNKDDLLELMADHVLAGLPEPSLDGPWQDELLRFFVAFHELLLEHPAVARVMLERTVAGPQITHRGEAVLACLVRGGLSDGVAVEAFTALTWYTLGGSLYAIARGLADDEARADRGRRFEQLPAEEFPTLHRVGRHFAEHASRDHFRNGLLHLIRGYDEAP